MSRYCVYVQSQTQFSELERVAKLVVARRGHRCRVAIDSADALLHERARFGLGKLVEDYRAPAAESSAWRRWLTTDLAVRTPPAPPPIDPVQLDQHNERARAGRYCAAFRVDTLVVGEDGLGGPYQLIDVVKRQGGRVVVVPYEYSGRKQLMRHLAIFEPEPDIDGRWIRDGRLRLPAPIIRAIESSGVSLPTPWTVHGGQADALLAESPRMVEHYHHEGIATDKIVLTGSLSHDDLKQHLDAAMPPGNRLRVLCAFPPDYCGLPAQYDELINRWTALMRQPGVDVVYQGHPSAIASIRLNPCAPDLAPNDIVRLIANCDVLVTSVSSIIRLALLAGKPVLNFDFYKFDYDDYRDTLGVTTVADWAAFEAAYRALISREGYGRQRDDARSEASRWGLLDGRCGCRIADALKLSQWKWF
jgi:hypothetical protein